MTAKNANRVELYPKLANIARWKVSVSNLIKEVI